MGSRKLPRSLRLLRAVRTVIHGHSDEGTGVRSHFVYLGIGGSGCPDHRVIDKLCEVTPHVHAAMGRLLWRQTSGLNALTPAEHEVLSLMLDHKTNKEIARLLGKSSATVRNQLHAIFKKLNVRSRGAAIMRVRNLQFGGRVQHGATPYGAMPYLVKAGAQTPPNTPLRLIRRTGLPIDP